MNKQSVSATILTLFTKNLKSIVVSCSLFFVSVGCLLWVPCAEGATLLARDIDWNQTGWPMGLPLQESTTDDSPTAVISDGVTITLRQPETNLTGKIVLGDVAAIESPDSQLAEDLSALYLADVPQYGESVSIFPGRVDRAVRSFGLSTGQYELLGPDRIVIESPAQSAEMQDIQNLIEQAFQKEYADRPDISVRSFLVHRASPVTLPPGQVEMEVIDLDHSGRNIRHVQVAFKVDQKVVDTKTYPVKVEFQCWGWIAATDLAAGDLLTVDNISQDYVPCGHPSENENLELERILQSSVRRPLRRGEALKLKDLQIQPLRSQGSAVTLTQVYGGVSLSVPGELMEDLVDVGQPVRVRNLRSREVLNGIAVGPETVQIP